MDVTVISRWVRTVEDAEKEKRKKYREYFGDFDDVAFSSFALDFGGGIGKDAWKIMDELGRLTC